MQVLEYVLLVVLLVSAVFIVVAVLLQKSNEDGLSGTIAGGQETFYGKDKSAHADRALFRWTLVAAIIFALAVVAVYIIQPDYASSYSLDQWKELSDYASIFPAE
ncbi:MAG: preprotein translocase subunit SecG [Clostridia bacterium]|nr:preprotein translocase subunit SecG [Clostridia bacterium]